MTALPKLDIVIPVFEEADNILPVLASLGQSVRAPFRVLICYDQEGDTTLQALQRRRKDDLSLRLVKNPGRGVLGAILAGLQASSAPAVLTYPADDPFNAPIIDRMLEQFDLGCDIVVASRFSPGGCMQGAPLAKAVLVRSSAWALHALARLPTRDPSNGLRLFSRRVVDSIGIESRAGFAYSLELLVKCHRLGWTIGEVPASWYRRKHGKSRFRVWEWLPQYLIWFRYAFATTWFLRGPDSVRLKPPPGP